MQGHIVYKRLLQYSKQYWLLFLLGIVGTIISSGMDASFTWLIKPMLDKGFIGHDRHFIRWLPVILISVFIIRNLASFMSNYFMASAGRHIVTQFRKDLFAKFMALPAQYLDNHTAGQLLSTLIYNVEQVSKASTDAIVTVFQQSFFILGLITVMFINSWKLSLIFFAIAPLVALIAKKSGKKMRKLSQHVQQSMSGVVQVAEEGLSGYRVIRTFGSENYEINKFNRLSDKNRQKEMHTIATDSLATAAIQCVIAVLISGVVYLATTKIGTITAGTFVSIITAMLAMLKPLRTLTTVNSTIQKGIAGADSIFTVLDEPSEPDHGTTLLSRASGDIIFNNINFSYDNNNNQATKIILNTISFHIKPGQTIALVGRSGSGKSTLVSLLPRFYDNYTGQILIDGIDSRELSLHSLRHQFALVSQNVVLFNDTVGHNIAYGRLHDFSEKDIIEAAEYANAMEFIRELPQGLHTPVGDNGVLLSGGQRQRIAIARALLKNAPILILDEATSALDTESEYYIQLALEKLMKTRTTLVIAHRLSTIEKADKIMVLDQGMIVETGTHQELLALNNYYARLHQKNFQE